MIAFWVISALLVAVALAFVAPRLLRGPQMGKRALGREAAEARRQLKSLEQAYRDGHVQEADYQARREEITGQLMETVESDEQPDPALRSPITGIVLVVLTPLLAILMYREVGDPVAVKAASEGWITMNSTPAPAAQNPNPQAPAETGGQPAGEQQAPDLTQAIAGLEERLANNPEDVDGWFLLGRSYMTVQNFERARDAYGKALELAPEEGVIMVEYAEALAFASGQPQLPQEAEELLREALRLNPQSQKGLWMLGLSEMQKGKTAEGLDLWEQLLEQLQPGTEVFISLVEQINQARAQLGMDPLNAPPLQPGQAMAATPPPTETPTPDSDHGVGLTVSISLSDELAAQVQPSDVLFVFARAVNGPPMPLAIQRLAAGQLPLTIRLDETMSMMPAMSLATFPEVIVGARISKTGEAMAQPGDFQALSDPVANNSAETIELRIDTVL